MARKRAPITSVQSRTPRRVNQRVSNSWMAQTSQKKISKKKKKKKKTASPCGTNLLPPAARFFYFFAGVWAPCRRPRAGLCKVVCNDIIEPSSFLFFSVSFVFFFSFFFFFPFTVNGLLAHPRQTGPLEPWVWFRLAGQVLIDEAKVRKKKKKKKKGNLLSPPQKKKVMRTLWIEHRTSRLAVRLISLQSGALPTELSPLYMFCKEMCFYSTTMYISWWSCVGNKYMCFFFVFLFFCFLCMVGK